MGLASELAQKMLWREESLEDAKERIDMVQCESHSRTMAYDKLINRRSYGLEFINTASYGYL